LEVVSLQIDADELLGTVAVEAGVSALASRNAHHLEAMAPGERDEAIAHWRELAVEVLSAARASVGVAPSEDQGPGRAVIVLEDAGGEEVAIHATFAPELQHLDNGDIAGTPCQLMALELLDALAGEGDE
jgi:hypothetical protein